MDSEEPNISDSDLRESPPFAEEPRTENRERHPRSRFKIALLALLGLLFFAGLLTIGVLPRIKRQKKITEASQAIKEATPLVSVITAREGPATSGLELPGNIEAIQTASISARTNGYLRCWYVDIGDRVQAGQLLAEIDTPEVDQQLQQSIANLTQAQANLGQAEANLRQAITNMEYTRVTYERWKYLAGQHVVSDQDRDQTWEAYNAAKATVDAQRANVNVAKATIAANAANVRQLAALQGFKLIYAPFAGIITARNVEIGSLINAGSATNASTSTGSPPTGTTIPGTGAAQTSPGVPAAGSGLFQIARIDCLRIYINVPQTFTSSIKPGQTVDINVREFPRSKFTGKVGRTTSALDPASRTLLTEVRIPNSKNDGYQLLPGMYATVNIEVKLAQPLVRIPATALVIRSDGTQVVTVDKDQKARFQNVVIGRDYGNELDILSGLEPGATIVVNVPDTLQDGAHVCPQPSPTGDQMNNQLEGQQPQKGEGRKKSGSEQNGNTVKVSRAFNNGVRRGDGAKSDHKNTNSGSGPK
ncbi:MAG: efflux RND transporter periplasmic adaptor subunit [Blastocatellia bacterium]|nr:efflux RND transporter periplasmic adaptor subunit [Blastocatellia bacterium]